MDVAALQRSESNYSHKSRQLLGSRRRREDRAPSDVAGRFASQIIEAMPEVGADRLRIGIGVRDPSWPYGFLVGVACDCASCHSGVTARDRDRQRQQMFEALGWRLDSVWSMD